jgi:hypothetical protein
MRITYLCKFFKTKRALLRDEDHKKLMYIDLDDLDKICPFFYVGDSGTLTRLPSGKYKLVLDTEDFIEVVPMLEHKKEESNEQYSL